MHIFGFSGDKFLTFKMCKTMCKMLKTRKINEFLNIFCKEICLSPTIIRFLTMQNSKLKTNLNCRKFCKMDFILYRSLN